MKELVCGKDEVILHEHTAEDGCYEAVMDNNGNQMQDENGELLWRLVCDKPEVLEHVHDDGCYQEHVHTEECFAEDLICGKEEHVHTEECFEGTVYCGLETHTHTEECYEVNEAGEKVLKCGLEEHEHSFACYIGPEVSEEDRERILYVDQLIDELPSYEEIGMELAAYEEAGDDEGYEEYYLDTAFWAEISYRYYEDLDELQKYVVNGPKLLEMSSLWEASTMALDNTARIVNCLKDRYVIVSGLARGVDARAHTEALDKSTIGILGCGIDRVYPRDNSLLFSRMRKDHLILSEYPPGTPPLPRHFPWRNRLIAAAADLLVVTEAREKSGTMYTVDEALALSVPVWCVPTEFGDESHMGCNRLILQGAGILCDLQQVREL